MKLLVIIGRKWFDKRAGNTYHDAEIIYADGEKLLQHRTHMDYGYGEGYVQSAAAWLESQGVINLERYTNGAIQPLWQFCKDNGIKLITTEAKVEKKHDLKGG